MPKEKEKFLKSEDIRTMKKDIARLQGKVPEKPGFEDKKEKELKQEGDALKSELRERERMETKRKEEGEKEVIERLKRVEKERIELEALRLEKIRKIEAERRRVEQTRIEEEKKEEGKRLEEEGKKQEEQERRAQEEERKRKEQELRRIAEEQQRKEEEGRRRIIEQETIKRTEEEKRQAHEKSRLEEEKKKQEEEQKRIFEEQARKAEQERVTKEEEERLREQAITRRKAEREDRIEEQKKREEIIKGRRTEWRRQQEEEEQRKEEAKRLEEEAKRAEEQRLREVPEERRKILLEKQRELKEKQDIINKELRKITEQRKTLEFPKAALLRDIEDIQKGFNAISKRENKAEEEKGAIQEKEAAAKTLEEKKRIEKERWEIEEKIRSLEKRRWPWDKKLIEVEEKIEKIDLESGEVKMAEEDLRSQKEELSKTEENIQLKIEKIDLNKELKEIEETKKSLEKKKDELFNALNEIEVKLEAILEKEERAEEDEKLIVEEEKVTKDLNQRQRLEKERWEIEEKRRNIESKRWEIEEEKNRLEIQIKGIDKRFQAVLEKAGDAIERIKKIDQVMGAEEPEEKEIKEKSGLFAPAADVSLMKKPREYPPIKEKPEEKPARNAFPSRRDAGGEKEEEELVEPEAPPIKEEPEKDKEIEEAKKRIEAIKKEKDLSRPSSSVAPPVEESLIGQEPEKEEEREPDFISPLEAEEKPEERPEEEKTDEETAFKKEEKKRRSLLTRIQAPSKEIEEPSKLPPSPKPTGPIIRPLPKKPTIREKLWVRVLVFSLVLILLAGVSTFWYWYLVIRRQPPPSLIECTANSDCPSDKVCSQAGICVDKSLPIECTADSDCPPNHICGADGVCIKKSPVIEIPPSLFLVDDTRTVAISDLGELRDLFIQVVQEWQDPAQFKRVVIKNTKENKVVDLRAFFDALQVRVSDEFYQKLDNNFTLFVYSQIDGNRVGFVSELADKEGLTILMRSLETTMKDDFKPIFNLMKEGEPAPVTFFRNASQVAGYVGPNFRYQTLTQEDLGMCYLISDKHFVFTSSWKSMTAIIDRLAVEIPIVELTTELKFGDQSEEVRLLQTWLAADPTVYPQAIISGFFGRLTEAGVTRFQEKYAADILAPQGLYQGTGIVDFYTRIKLNELYGQTGIIPHTVELITGLQYGDHGDEVRLLQTWLAKDTEVYPKGITSGWFGPLTRAAVIRFQEKYIVEILVPQGLSRGTGIVDKLTRDKLNLLYGN